MIFYTKLIYIKYYKYITDYVTILKAILHFAI